MIERSAGTKAGLRLKLDLASDRTQAEELRGLLLTVPAPRWHRCRMAPTTTSRSSTWTGVGGWGAYGKGGRDIDYGSNDIYVVRASGSKDILVPAIAGVVLKIDLDQNEMVVRIPQGLT